MAYSAPVAGTVASGANNVAPGAPAGSGGLLLLAAYERGGAAVNTPTGWTSLTSAGSGRLVLFGRIADGSGDDTPTVSAASAGLLVAQLARAAGAPTSISGIAAATASPAFNSSVDITTPSLTAPSEDNCLVVVVGAKEDDVGPTVSPPSGFTLIDDSNIDGPSLDAWLTWAYQIQTTASAVSASSFDTANASTADARAVMVALKTLDATEIAGTDTASLSATEADTEFEYASVELAYLAVSETASIASTTATSDSGSLTATEAASYVGSGLAEKAGTDTASLAATEAAASIAVSIAGTDTASLSASETGSADPTEAYKDGTDTASLSVDELSALNIITGSTAKSGADIASLAIGESATVRDAPRLRTTEVTFGGAGGTIDLS